MKHIHNIHRSLVKANFKELDDKGKPTGKLIWHEFFPRIMNNYTGQLTHTGYTPIEEEALARLQKESNVFKGFVKSGKLKILDKLPAIAQSAAEVVMEKDKLIAELTRKVAELEKTNGVPHAEVQKQLAAAKAETDKAVEEVRLQVSKTVEEAVDAANKNHEAEAELHEAAMSEANARIGVLEELLTQNKIELPKKEDKPAQF
jgi:hypothetical protein